MQNAVEVFCRQPYYGHSENQIESQNHQFLNGLRSDLKLPVRRHLHYLFSKIRPHDATSAILIKNLITVSGRRTLAIVFVKSRLKNYFTFGRPSCRQRSNKCSKLYLSTFRVYFYFVPSRAVPI